MAVSDKIFQQKLVRIGVVLTTLLLGYCVHAQWQDAYGEKVRAYLKSPDFIHDFSQPGSSPQQDVLVDYPKISFYLTFKYNTRTQYSENEQLNALERQCDFVIDLFEKFSPSKSQKKAILKLLKQDNIIIENIYRNTYADVLFTTKQTLSQCEQWYPSPL